MTLQIIADNLVIPVEHIEFSDGASNLRVLWPEGEPPKKRICISIHPSTPVDSVLPEVLLALDCIDERIYRGDSLKLDLDLPYLPHGRADRRFDKNCAHPLEVFLTHMCRHFDEILLTDPHSGAAVDIIKHHGNIVRVKEQHDCFLEMRVPFNMDSDIFIGPDEGAKPKIVKLVEAVPGANWICASKTRDPLNGRVLSTSVPDVPLHGSRCIIVDDICDGGGTFLPLAQCLRDKGAASVDLYVTHGIFAKGLDPFKGLIDKLHVYQIVSNYISREDLAHFNETTWGNQ